MRSSNSSGAEYSRHAQEKPGKLSKINFSPKGSDTAQEANLSLASSSACAAVTKEQRGGKTKDGDMACSQVLNC